MKNCAFQLIDHNKNKQTLKIEQNNCSLSNLVQLQILMDMYGFLLMVSFKII